MPSNARCGHFATACTSATTSSAVATPQRFSPTSNSTSTFSRTSAAAAARASAATFAASSTHTVRSAFPASAVSRAIFSGCTT